VAWTFAVVAVASLIAAREAFVRFGYLAAGIAGAIAFLAVCDELLEDGIAQEPSTFRNVFVVAAVALLVAAFVAYRSGTADEHEAAELVTASGILFVVGIGIVGLVFLYVSGLASVVPGAAGALDGGSAPEPSAFWDGVLGLGSLALVVGGNMLEKRGPVYVGGAGLAIFIAIVGTDLDNPDRDGSLVGWPLILTLAAIVALVASAVGSQRDTPQNTAQRQQPPPDPGGTPWNT
jgi:cytochrome bd-type quinol oxidase subunit 2